MSSVVNHLYKFGDFLFDAQNLALWRGGELVPLPAKALEVLRILLENDGRIVAKREIFSAVWADTFVEDGVLSQNIYTLRGALGADESGKQMIETIPRRGYRFAVRLEILRSDETAAIEVERAANSFVIERQELKTPVGKAADFSPPIFTPPSPPALNEFIETQKNFVKTALAGQRQPAVYRWLILAAICLIMIAVGAVYWFAPRSNPKNEVVTAPVEQVKFQRLTDSGDVLNPTIAPNGELLAYIRTGETEQSVWLKQIATGSELQILPPSTRGYASLAFAPDGSYLYFREKNGKTVFQKPMLAGAPRKTAENVVNDFSVSPDGLRLGFVRRQPKENATAVILADLDGSGEREIAVRKLPIGFNDAPPVFSPDGATVIASGSSGTEARPVLLAIETATGAERELTTPNWREIVRFLWMPDGKRLIVAARAGREAASQLWLYDVASGDARRLTNDLENYFWLSLSADGRRLVTRQQQIASHLWLIENNDLSKARALTTGVRARDGLRGLVWTGAGKIVFTSFEESVANLHALDPATGDRVRLIDNPVQDSTYPSVSADGRTIAFTANMTSGRQIWRMDADGRRRRQLTDGDVTQSSFASAVSPDGSTVYFIRRADAPPTIWKMSIDGENPQPLMKIEDAVLDDFLAISPDGRWLAFRQSASETEATDGGAPQKMSVVPVDGSAAPRFFELPLRRPAIQWAKDSKAVYFAGGVPSGALWRQSIDGGAPQKILQFPDRVFNFAFAPDGNSLVAARGKLIGDAVLLTNLQ